MRISDGLLLCLIVAASPAAWMAMPHNAPVQVAQAQPATESEPAAQPAPADAAPAAEPPAAAVPSPAPAAAEPTEEERLSSMANTPARPVELQDVMEEVSELRAQVLKLQQTLDAWMQTSLADLKSENESLRKELRDLAKNGAVEVPPVPTPDSELIKNAMKEPAEGSAEPTTPADPEVATAVAKMGYFTVAEFGASPKEAAKANPPRASLKGLIGVVLPGMSDDDLTALGKRLHKECNDYENINIELFNDRAAAEAFKAGQSVEPGRRVLSISRHKASGRDVIWLLKGETAVPVPVEGEAVGANPAVGKSGGDAASTSGAASAEPAAKESGKDAASAEPADAKPAAEEKSAAPADGDADAKTDATKTAASPISVGEAVDVTPAPEEKTAKDAAPANTVDMKAGAEKSGGDAASTKQVKAKSKAKAKK